MRVLPIRNETGYVNKLAENKKISIISSLGVSFLIGTLITFLSCLNQDEQYVLVYDVS